MAKAQRQNEPAYPAADKISEHAVRHYRDQRKQQTVPEQRVPQAAAPEGDED